MHDDPDFADLSKLRKKKAIPPYPFSGIVGQQSMKKALLLVAVNPRIGSLLIRGENGIGKMTAALALESLLPTIEVSAECFSNCDIGNKDRLCITCSKRSELEAREVKHPFIRLPVGTSDHRIFGGFEKDRGSLKYRCPAKHYGLDCADREQCWWSRTCSKHS